MCTYFNISKEYLFFESVPRLEGMSQKFRDSHLLSVTLGCYCELYHSFIYYKIIHFFQMIQDIFYPDALSFIMGQKHFLSPLPLQNRKHKLTVNKKKLESSTKRGNSNLRKVLAGLKVMAEQIYIGTKCLILNFI